MKAVIYTRVSTKKQQKSTLGLKSQLRECETFCKRENIEIIGYEQDIESGANDDRVGLNRAIKLAQKNNAVVMCNRLDRLSRDLHFISGLVKYNVPFCITQLGKSVSTMVIYQYALWSQLEREIIASRIKSALKESDKPLGASNPIIKAAVIKSNKIRGEASFDRIMPHIREAQSFLLGIDKGKKPSLRRIADYLFDKDVLSARGKKLQPKTISLYIKKAETL